jgi:hypothetical protein
MQIAEAHMLDSDVSTQIMKTINYYFNDDAGFYLLLFDIGFVSQLTNFIQLHGYHNELFSTSLVFIRDVLMSKDFYFNAYSKYMLINRDLIQQLMIQLKPNTKNTYFMIVNNRNCLDTQHQHYLTLPRYNIF